MPDHELVIGVDGGGTGCRARIEDAEGRVLGMGSGGPAALRLGIERSMSAVDEACRAAIADAGLRVDALGAMDAAIGLSGLGRKGFREQLHARPHPFRSVRYLEDAIIACVGAHGGRDGGIVILGTGSVGLAMVESREIRAGGYGFPVSDEGSGAALGLEAVRSALRASDGRVPATAFTREVMSRFADDPFELVGWMDRATATDYATLAPLVTRHAGEGDAVASGIVRGAASQVDGIVRRLVEQGALRIALLGGLASSMEPWLAADVREHLSHAEGDALDGALNVARHAAATRKC